MRSRVAAVLGFFVAVVFVSVSAQTTQDSAARKIYEFGASSSEYQKALMDFFAIEIQRNADAEAYIVTYGPEGDGLGTGKQLAGMYKDYLVDIRGLEAQRVKAIYGGHNNDPHQAKTELWMVPKGAQPPSLIKNENDFDTFRGRFADLKADDDFGVVAPEEEPDGIGKTTDASFAEMLHKQENAVGYIVAYNGNDASPGAWRRVADNQVNQLTQLGVDVTRLKVIFGGSQKDTRIALWILPKSDPAPVVGSKELPLRKAVKSGEFYIDSLQYEQNRERFFSNISSALREYPTVRAYMIVHLDRKNGPASLTKMVRTWRTELKSKYNIGADRFIVRFARPGEVIAIYLELWMVPKGKPLPNLHKEER